MPLQRVGFWPSLELEQSSAVIILDDAGVDMQQSLMVGQYRSSFHNDRPVIGALLVSGDSDTERSFTYGQEKYQGLHFQQYRLEIYWF